MSDWPVMISMAPIVMAFNEDEQALSRDRINIMGGGISIGHPLGATGSRILGTLARLLRQKGKKLGVATLCVGGGQGYSVVLEAE